MMSLKNLICSCLFVGLAFSTLTSTAQQKYFMGRNSFHEDIKVGLKIGSNFAKMAYTDDRMSDIDHNFKSRFLVGAVVEIPLIKAISISPEILYVGRGTFANYKNKNDIFEDYRIRTHCIDLRVPVLFNIPVNGFNRFYFYVAPDVALALGGDISQVESGDIGGSTNRSANIDKNNMALVDFSVAGGAGCRFNIRLAKGMFLLTRIEVGYNHGFIDTFSNSEKSGNTPSINVNSYSVKGMRTNRGIEAAIILSIPIPSKDAFCR